jgi:hypothetical protein
MAADLKQQFLAGVAAIYDTLRSVQRPVTLIFPPGAYDPATDQSAPGAQSLPINAFIYREEQRQGADSSGYSFTILLQVSEVVAAGVADKVDQSVKAIVDGVTYEVEFVGYDPVAATVKLYARK